MSSQPTDTGADTDGPADVDSGPLPLGISLSATVVTIGAAQVQGDKSLAAALANVGEFTGVPVDTPWTKRYAGGLVPVGDAFIAWSKTARPWVSDPPRPPPQRVSPWWRLPLLVLMILLALEPWLPAMSRSTGRAAGRQAFARRIAARVRQRRA